MATAPPLEDQHDTGPSHLYPKMPSNSSNGVLVTKIELRISCQNLRDRDIISKSDPMIVLFSECRVRDETTWKEIERTEVIKDTLNPFFVKSFLLEYHFEQYQKLKFEVYDNDSTSKNLLRHDYLGYIVVSLGNIIGEFGGKVTKPLLGKNDKKTNSTISFFAEELCDNKEMLTLKFKCRKLEKRGFLGHSDPFLVFYKLGIENTDYVAMYKTEIIKNNPNPIWKSFTIPVTTLCNGDKHRLIKIECYDWNADGSHVLIGECTVTLCEILDDDGFSSKELINPKKKEKKNYKNSGWLDLVKVDLKCEPSFLEYIVGGIELCFHVAFDFTASNGNPLQPTSLHFLDRDSPNKYTQALMAVGQICEDYDSDKLMPAYGFGAKIRGKVYHDFHLNQKDNPNCVGILGVLDAYEKFLPTAELYGPTNFSPVINLVAKTAEQQKNNKKYHVLLILTNGMISDMDQTKNAIINASQFPISIIIVGIGDADFSAMDELDCDKGKITFQGRVAKQDIVQFIPFQKFSGSFAADDLAREVLYEVPNQLVTYMTRHGIKPQPSSQTFTRFGMQMMSNSGISKSTKIKVSAKEAAMQTLARYNAQ